MPSLLRLKTSLRQLLNMCSARGRQTNRRIRREQPWRVARAQALQQSRDLTCTVHGDQTMTVSPHDTAVGKTVFLTGGWEPAETQFIDRYVRPGMTVLDIGANVGAHTLLLAKRVGPQGQVHAFEPSAAKDYLQRNIESNRLSQVRYNPVALGAAPGTMRMVRAKPGLEAFSSFSAPLHDRVVEGYMDVPVTTLDDYVHDQALGPIALAKMDVEGAEVLVLRGAASLLRGQRVAVWLFEINDVCLANAGHSPDELIALFRDAGYQLFLLGNDGLLAPFATDKVKKNRDVLALTEDALRQMP